MLNKTNLEIAGEIAEKLRQEPYHLFKNDCSVKSAKFKKRCEAAGMRGIVPVYIKPMFVH